MNTQCEYAGRYREEQRFKQWWHYLLVGVLAVGYTALFGFAIFKQLALGQPWGDRPMSDSAQAIMGPLFILLGWALVWLVCWMRLRVAYGVAARGRGWLAERFVCGSIPCHSSWGRARNRIASRDSL